MAGFKYSNNLYGETRYREMIELVEEYCNPLDKGIVDLGAGNNPISNYIPCKKAIKIYFNPNNNPDIICDLNHDIPLDADCCDIVIAGEILEHIYYFKKLFNGT